MQIEETDGIALYLASLTAKGGNAEQIAEAVASTFQAIEHALAPIIGQRGAAALYARALHLSKSKFGWLPDSSLGAPTAIDVRPLTHALSGQTAGVAVGGGAELLRAFYELLSSLIGPVLTERLLRSVWVKFLSGPSAQDNTQ